MKWNNSSAKPPTALMVSTVAGLALGLFLMWMSGPENELRAILALGIPPLLGAIVGAALTGKRRFAGRKAGLAAMWLVAWPLLYACGVVAGWLVFVPKENVLPIVLIFVGAGVLSMILVNLLGSRLLGAGVSGDLDEQLEKSEADRAVFQEIASLREKQGGRLSESADDDAEGRLSGTQAGAVSTTAKKEIS